MIKVVLARLLASVLAVGTLSVASVAVAQPALAASCATSGLVSVADTFGGSPQVRFETDPIDGPYFPYFITIIGGGTAGFDVKLGGNGLMPGSAPSWSVFNGAGGFIGTLDGGAAGSNCVSNERVYPFFGSSGDVYLVRANYLTGNTNTTISQQNHFAVIFQ